MKPKSFKFKQRKVLGCRCLPMASIGLFPIMAYSTSPPTPEVQGVTHQVRKVKSTVSEGTCQPFTGGSVVSSGTKNYLLQTFILNQEEDVQRHSKKQS